MKYFVRRLSEALEAPLDDDEFGDKYNIVLTLVRRFATTQIASRIVKERFCLKLSGEPVFNLTNGWGYDLESALEDLKISYSTRMNDLAAGHRSFTVGPYLIVSSVRRDGRDGLDILSSGNTVEDAINNFDYGRE